MLEHADARDLVVEALAGMVAIILQQHAAPVLQPRRADALRRQPELVFRERDAGRIDAVLLGGPHDERAPAAADVEEALARREPQLGADVVELGELRLLERVFLAAEIGAGIHHARIEPQP